MNYQVRALPRSEWPRLAGTDLSEAWAHLDPARNTVLVVERAGQIIGHLVVMQVLHAEFLWIDPAHRGRASVLRRLLDRVRSLAICWGFPTVLAGSIDDRMRGILAGLGAERVPGEQYVVTVKGGI